MSSVLVFVPVGVVITLLISFRPFIKKSAFFSESTYSLTALWMAWKIITATLLHFISVFAYGAAFQVQNDGIQFVVNIETIAS